MEYKQGDIEDILKYSKPENKGFLKEILAIDKISLFDVLYIMSSLNLSKKKIEVIKLALSKYDTIIQSESKESYGDFSFRIIRNLEKLENRRKISKEFMDNDIKKNDTNTFADFLISKSVFSEENETQGYTFSPMFLSL